MTVLEGERLGAGIVNASWAGTGIFVATAALATAFPHTFEAVAAPVAIGLFLIGCAIFMWAYAVAVSRSRTDAIGIGGLFFLQGTAPKVVRFRLVASLVVQVAVAVASAAIRPFTSLAFGILVPMYGLALSGLWGARYGTFESRHAVAAESVHEPDHDETDAG